VQEATLPVEGMTTKQETASIPLQTSTDPGDGRPPPNNRISLSPKSQQQQQQRNSKSLKPPFTRETRRPPVLVTQVTNDTDTMQAETDHAVSNQSGLSFPFVSSVPTRITGILCIFVLLAAVDVFNAFASPPPARLHPHLLLPRHYQQRLLLASTKESSTLPILTDTTLREFLTDTAGFHLAMSPAFFGYYGYLGALAAWEEGVDDSILSAAKIHSLAGASAGAMTAVLLAAGMKPRHAAKFCAGMTVDRFADFPGLLGVFRGNKVEQIMYEYLRAEKPHASGLLQDADISVAVTAFDLQTMENRVLTTGSMARAARASASFPFLFMPVGWKDQTENDNWKEHVFIDGGIGDVAGLRGLTEALSKSNHSSSRVINLSVGAFLGKPPGPSTVPGSATVLSISIQNLPMCGPWAMANGPIAVDAAHRAMMATLDLPLYHGHEANHFELHIDASSFW
jgi:hypothetical protein